MSRKRQKRTFDILWCTELGLAMGEAMRRTIIPPRLLSKELYLEKRINEMVNG